MKTDLPYRPCVGLCVIDARGLIFAGQRIDMASDAWQMPQGGIDEGEAPEAAAFRELQEETSITPELVNVLQESDDWMRYDLPPDLVGKIWGGKYRGQRMKWYLMRFDGKNDDIKIKTDHPEFSVWQWKSKEELMETVVPFKKDIYQAVFARFSDHLA